MSLKMPLARAEIKYVLSGETCYSQDETKALAQREKNCQVCDKNLSSCEGAFKAALERGYKDLSFYEQPLFWGIVGGILGAVAHHNLTH